MGLRNVRRPAWGWGRVSKGAEAGEVREVKVARFYRTKEKVGYKPPPPKGFNSQLTLRRT